MPYIPFERRTALLKCPAPDNAGELNYSIFRLCQKYLSDHSTNYKTLNEIIGVLECCKQEFYRRVLVAYEERKKEENGDLI